MTTFGDDVHTPTDDYMIYVESSTPTDEADVLASDDEGPGQHDVFDATGTLLVRVSSSDPPAPGQRSRGATSVVDVCETCRRPTQAGEDGDPRCDGCGQPVVGCDCDLEA